jgi:hypothetical protein
VTVAVKSAAKAPSPVSLVDLMSRRAKGFKQVPVFARDSVIMRLARFDAGHLWGANEERK